MATIKIDVTLPAFTDLAYAQTIVEERVESLASSYGARVESVTIEDSATEVDQADVTVQDDDADEPATAPLVESLTMGQRVKRLVLSRLAS